MSTAPHGILFRVFEGSDCAYRYVAGAALSTDAIVWGSHLYNVRVKWRPTNLFDVLDRWRSGREDLMVKHHGGMIVSCLNSTVETTGVFWRVKCGLPPDCYGPFN